MGRDIKIGDHVKVYPGSTIYTITDIKIPYIYIKGHLVDNIIRIYPDTLKLVGQEDVPHTFEFFSDDPSSEAGQPNQTGLKTLKETIDLSPIEDPKLANYVKTFVQRYQAYQEETFPHMKDKDLYIKREIFQGQPYLGIHLGSQPPYKYRRFRINPKTYDILSANGKKPVANLIQDDYIFYSFNGLRNVNYVWFVPGGRHHNMVAEQNNIWKLYGLERY